MEIRTQMAVVGALAAVWVGGQWVRVRPMLDRATEAERMALGALEQRVAQHPDDAIATRVLLRRYLDHGMPRVVTDTVRRAPAGIQRDGVVSLLWARAEERLGNVSAANALVTGALGRCGAVPDTLADGAGCDVRTQTELTIEGAALERMIEWHITPVTDPARASVAHEIATRPVRITTR